MKKILLLLMLSMTCETVKTSRFYPDLTRCENDEVICYLLNVYKKGGLSCNFKTGAEK